MPKRTGLGMGLDALFEDNSGDSAEKQNVRMSQIEPNKQNPRKNIEEESITVLADSIGRHGLIQPILVRPFADGYQIVAGERRWRACRMLGMTEIPVIVKSLTDSQTAQIALIENIQREDLSPVDEAAAYRELMETHGMTQEQVSETVGKSRSAVANSVRLLSLPDPVLDMLKKGELTAGHAKAIAGLKNKEMMCEAAMRAKGDGITVRRLEAMVTEMNEEFSPTGKARNEKQALQDGKKSLKEKNDPEKQAMNYMTEMEISLENALSRKVKICSKDGEKGTITLDFFDKDDLSSLADKLTIY
ncbi:MAG: ParB/RepB/Spo0J family partition protein [Oscillospiraceae bacterium]|nr:ParB/RepB/Spo0J family partition protein [Oscillospiraceae bacterium]